MRRYWFSLCAWIFVGLLCPVSINAQDEAPPPLSAGASVSVRETPLVRPPWVQRVIEARPKLMAQAEVGVRRAPPWVQLILTPPTAEERTKAFLASALETIQKPLQRILPERLKTAQKPAAPTTDVAARERVAEDKRPGAAKPGETVVTLPAVKVKRKTDIFGLEKLRKRAPRKEKRERVARPGAPVEQDRVVVSIPTTSPTTSPTAERPRTETVPSAPAPVVAEGEVVKEVERDAPATPEPIYVFREPQIVQGPTVRRPFRRRVEPEPEPEPEPTRVTEPTGDEPGPPTEERVTTIEPEVIARTDPEPEPLSRPLPDDVGEDPEQEDVPEDVGVTTIEQERCNFEGFDCSALKTFILSLQSDYAVTFNGYVALVSKQRSPALLVTDGERLGICTPVASRASPPAPITDESQQIALLERFLQSNGIVLTDAGAAFQKQQECTLTLVRLIEEERAREITAQTAAILLRGETTLVEFDSAGRIVRLNPEGYPGTRQEIASLGELPVSRPRLSKEVREYPIRGGSRASLVMIGSDRVDRKDRLVVVDSNQLEVTDDEFVSRYAVKAWTKAAPGLLIVSAADATTVLTVVPVKQVPTPTSPALPPDTPGIILEDE